MHLSAEPERGRPALPVLVLPPVPPAACQRGTSISTRLCGRRLPLGRCGLMACASLVALSCRQHFANYCCLGLRASGQVCTVGALVFLSGLASLAAAPAMVSGTVMAGGIALIGAGGGIKHQHGTLYLDPKPYQPGLARKLNQVRPPPAPLKHATCLSGTHLPIPCTMQC